MKRNVLLGMAVGIIAGLTFIVANIGCNKIRLSGEREGYERGLRQGLIYRQCSAAQPSAKFIEKNWNMVNMPNDCRYIAMAERQESEKR